MNCKKIQEYIPEYIQNDLSLFRHYIVARHLRCCSSCRHHSQELSDVLRKLKLCSVPELDPGIWDGIKTSVLSRLSAPITPRYFLALGKAACFLILIFLGYVTYSFFFLHPNSNPTPSHKDYSLFSMNFFHDTWDFCAFFNQLDKEKLAQMSPRIEKAFKSRLQKELALNNEESSQLFPVLIEFGKLMKEYYDRYSSALASLSEALQQGMQADLEKYLRQLQSIREDWNSSRWSLLHNVQTILSQEKFARFLLFTERLPSELKAIFVEAAQDPTNQG